MIDTGWTKQSIPARSTTPWYTAVHSFRPRCPEIYRGMPRCPVVVSAVMSRTAAHMIRGTPRDTTSAPPWDIAGRRAPGSTPFAAVVPRGVPRCPAESRGIPRWCPMMPRGAPRCPTVYFSRSRGVLTPAVCSGGALRGTVATPPWDNAGHRAPESNSFAAVVPRDIPQCPAASRGRGIPRYTAVVPMHTAMVPRGAPRGNAVYPPGSRGVPRCIPSRGMPRWCPAVFRGIPGRMDRGVPRYTAGVRCPAVSRGFPRCPHGIPNGLPR